MKHHSKHYGKLRAGTKDKYGNPRNIICHYIKFRNERGDLVAGLFVNPVDINGFSGYTPRWVLRDRLTWASKREIEECRKSKNTGRKVYLYKSERKRERRWDRELRTIEEKNRPKVRWWHTAIAIAVVIIGVYFLFMPVAMIITVVIGFFAYMVGAAKSSI